MNERDQERPLDPPDDDLIETLEDIARQESIDDLNEHEYRKEHSTVTPRIMFQRQAE